MTVSLKRKGKKGINVNVRRSVRIDGSVLDYRQQEIDRLIDSIVFSEGDRDDEAAVFEEVPDDVAVFEKKKLEDKLDHLIKLLQRQETKYSPYENVCLCHAKYISLYFDSRKKIESLTNEKHHLALNVENLQGRLEIVCVSKCHVFLFNF
ncbi:hypothetical protein Pint_30524 [Pistacia integerrima]|uniref:Uncharacterized protein n=1 Tax=Pistacia integerrima TaxID=434235 RepID=A0ACC0WY84_9ROSI|nr:hypothetical protein Pint_30524 [Pistacia integerrima]